MTSPNSHEILATTVLMGQASDAEQTEFNRLMTNDEDFRTLVRELEAWLSPLNSAAPKVAPPEGLFDDIMAEIDAKIVPAPVQSYATQNRRVASAWRPAALIAAAAALVSTGLHFMPGTAPSVTPKEDLVALMSGESNPEVILIVYDPEARKVLATLSNTSLPDAGVWQLWRIREGASAPDSLGVLDAGMIAGDRLEIEINRDLTIGTDTLAISLEPPGGSPDPTPTGPVLFTGKVSAL